MNLTTFLIFNVIVVVSSVLINYYVTKNDTDNNESILDTINNHNLTLRGIVLGGVFGFVFGLIDNLFLFIGLDNLIKYFPGNHMMKSGWSNTYSDVIASFVGTFAGSIMQTITKSHGEEFPLWANSLGIFFGCVAGMYIGRVVAKYT